MVLVCRAGCIHFYKCSHFRLLQLFPGAPHLMHYTGAIKEACAQGHPPRVSDEIGFWTRAPPDSQVGRRAEKQVSSAARCCRRDNSRESNLIYFIYALHGR